MKQLTIFTPTYNRAYILPQLYNSLVEQTNKNFLWLIVDDGSKDNTKELVENWIKENKIEINYILQENGGKMRAHNTGVKNCKTELFLCVDSDDYVAENAVEKILNKSNELLERKELSAIVAYRGKSRREVIGTEFPKNVKDASLGTIYKKGFVGDTALIFKTEILKEYLFPEIDGEKFITEDYVYCQIDEKYKMMLLPEIIIICKYLDDGYTKNGLKLIYKNPIGTMMYYRLKIKKEKNLLEKIKLMVRYISFGKLTKQANLYRKSNARMLFVLCYVPSLFYYLKKKKLLKNLD